VDQRRNGRDGSMLSAARLIAATLALRHALPPALSGDRVSLDDGLSPYR
jgi:hypothetical protein